MINQKLVNILKELLKLDKINEKIIQELGFIFIDLLFMGTVSETSIQENNF